MIIPDLKNKVASIVSSRRHSDGTTTTTPMNQEVSENKDGETDGRHMAAQEMIEAFHNKSPQRLLEAMGNFIDLHHLEREKPEPGK